VGDREALALDGALSDGEEIAGAELLQPPSDGVQMQKGGATRPRRSPFSPLGAQRELGTPAHQLRRSPFRP
jgi:hypothetical protein